MILLYEQCAEQKPQSDSLYSEQIVAVFPQIRQRLKECPENESRCEILWLLGFQTDAK